jgi:hypothetical protein
MSALCQKQTLTAVTQFIAKSGLASSLRTCRLSKSGEHPNKNRIALAYARFEVISAWKGASSGMSLKSV